MKLSMENRTDLASSAKDIFYTNQIRQVQALFENETDPIANMANLAAFLYHSMEQINWVGFYRLVNGALIVGPFMGKPACVHITIGSGVCGTCVVNKSTVLVDDVHQFPGHISCDSESNSEIVIPLIKNGKVLGVLDIDSPILNRFTKQDQKGLEAIVDVFLESTIF